MTAAARTAPVPGRRTLQSEKRGEMLAGFALIAVPVALFLILNIGAIVYALFISFWRWGARGPRGFLGLDNYQELIGDERFWIAVRNTSTSCSGM